MNSGADNEATAATRSARSKRWGFGLVVLGVSILALEAGSWLLFLAVDDQAFGFARVAGEREAARKNASFDRQRDTQEREDVPRHAANKFVHPYVGYVQDPSGRPPNVPGRRDLPINQFGYVDNADPIHQRAPDKFIIGIVGGSVARDFSLIASEHLAERLGRGPTFAGREIVFVRLALSGYKQPQQLMTIAYLLSLGAEFDAVVNLDGFNEVALHLAENAKTHTFAAFPRHWYYEIVDLPERVSDEYQYLRVQRRRVADAFSRPLVRHSVTANLLWRLWDRQLSHDLYAAHERMLAEAPKARSAEASGPYRAYADEEDVVEDLVAIWKRSSLQLDRLLRANGTAYFQVLHPNQYYPDTKPMGEKERRSAFKADYKYRRGAVLGYPLLVSEGQDLRRQGVRFLDLSRAFAERSDPLYVDACCHYNKWGHRLIAEAVADDMLVYFGSGGPTS